MTTDVMTLDERLKLAYLDGAPPDVDALLRGEYVKRPQDAYEAVKALSDAAGRRQGEISDRIGRLRRGLEARKYDLANSEIPIELLCSSPLDYLVDRINRHNALLIACERIEAEIERAESEYSTDLEAGKSSNLLALSRLADARIRQGIPSEELAAKFGATPEELTPPGLWVGYVEEKREREEREEQKRLELQQQWAEADAKREPYVPPPSIGCPVCDHEKHWEIHKKLYPGITERALDALSAEYGVSVSAILEHYNGHPVLRPKPVIPLPQPKPAPAPLPIEPPQPPPKPNGQEASSSSDLWDRLVLALNNLDDIILKSLFQQFKNGEPSRQLAEYILKERNALRNRNPKREAACEWLLVEAARLNPQLIRYAEEAR